MRPVTLAGSGRLAAILVTTVLLSGAGTAAEERRFDVTFDDKVISANNESLSSGDRVILNDLLEQNGSEAGRVAGLCTVTDPAGLMICNITFRLSDGSISTQFVNSPPPEKTFALFAGTGALQGRSGMGVLTEFGDGTGSLVLTLD